MPRWPLRHRWPNCCLHASRVRDVDLTTETAFLAGYDAFKKHVSILIDMPDRLIDLLFRFLRQKDRTLFKRASETSFANLTATEAPQLEAIYQEILPQLGGNNAQTK